MASVPWMRTEPREPVRPRMARSVVVRPAPLRPSSVTTSWPTRISTPCRICDSSYQACRPEISSAGVLMHVFAIRLRCPCRPASRRVARDFGIRAFRQHRSARQHGDGVGDRRHHVHVVFDHQDGAAGADALDQLVTRSTSSWPMPWVGSSSSISWAPSPAWWRFPARACGRRAGSPWFHRRRRPDPPVRAARAPARSARPAACRCARSGTTGRSCAQAMRTFSNTVRCGNTAEIWNERITPRRAICGTFAGDVDAVELDGSRRGKELRQQIEACGLARAVRPDQGMNLAPLDTQSIH